jgi:hypothetical protein
MRAARADHETPLQLSWGVSGISPHPPLTTVSELDVIIPPGRGLGAGVDRRRVCQVAGRSPRDHDTGSGARAGSIGR